MLVTKEQERMDRVLILLEGLEAEDMILPLLLRLEIVLRLYLLMDLKNLVLEEDVDMIIKEVVDMILMEKRETVYQLGKEFGDLVGYGWGLEKRCQGIE
jgi:hypothetical protein